MAYIQLHIVVIVSELMTSLAVFFVFFADAWQQILVPILRMRKEAGLVNLFPQYITGEVSEIHNMLTAIII